MSQTRQLAAVMFTDIVGYTALMGNDEEKAFQLLRKNREIQKPIIEPLNHLTIWFSPVLWLSQWQSYLNGTLQLSSRISSFAGSQTWGHDLLSGRGGL